FVPIAIIAPGRRPCPLLFAGPAAPDRGSQRGRNECASSCLTSAARDGGTGAASASYWSLTSAQKRPVQRVGRQRASCLEWHRQRYADVSSNQFGRPRWRRGALSCSLS